MLCLSGCFRNARVEILSRCGGYLMFGGSAGVVRISCSWSLERWELVWAPISSLAWFFFFSFFGINYFLSPDFSFSHFLALTNFYFSSSISISPETINILERWEVVWAPISVLVRFFFSKVIFSFWFSCFHINLISLYKYKYRQANKVFDIITIRTMTMSVSTRFNL